ncbi:hypothetical protein [Lentzea sp. NPDC059081]|uniref:hypothetical protein n=1 Tax=Lentzea sp. NPDC059081 TaxID=3346719 RepID=UPI0036D0EAC2
MELKQAMEAATADLDVRPGFVGDVMTGARRRHTRRLVAVTAAVALLAGVSAGVVLSRPDPPPPPLTDARLTAATAGDLAGDQTFLSQAHAIWGRSRSEGLRPYENVTEFTGPAHVFWAANTPSGPAALLVQPVEVGGEPAPRMLIGLVAGGAVVQRELDRGQEIGLYQFGPDRSTYLALGMGSKVFWSVNPVRGPDNRLSRTWQEAEMGPGGVAVITATLSERPVFIRGDTTPLPRDFFSDPLQGRFAWRPDTAFLPHPGNGWSGRQCASDSPVSGVRWSAQNAPVPKADLQRLGLLDYVVDWDATGDWNVCAWLPDGRYAEVFEAYGDLYGAIYHPDGSFSAPLLGGKAVKGSPVVMPLPDGQGTIVADFDARIGPQGRVHAWLAPVGTKEVTVRRGDASAVVPLT